MLYSTYHLMEGYVQAAGRDVAYKLPMALGLEQDPCKCYLELPTKEMQNTSAIQVPS